MADPKVLTDIKIGQSPEWCSRTDYLAKGDKGAGRMKGEAALWDKFCRLIINCSKYDVVVTADIKTAQLFGLFRTLFRCKKPGHIILELMLDEAREDIRWKIKNLFQRICFSSVDVVFVSSRREIETYACRLRIPENRIRFLPFHTNVIHPRMKEGAGGYILSAGRTGRDYATLAAAVDGLKAKVLIVSDRYHVEALEFPDNVEVYCDITYEKYLELLNGCSMVVVPLQRLVKSTGQVVFLEAMALGKPVIATFTTGTEDYIEDKVTGFLVPPEDPLALRAAIECLLEDPGLQSSMAMRSLEVVKEKHTFEAYTRTILETAREVASYP